MRATAFLPLSVFCCCLCIFVLGASPVIAGPADILNGSWAVDVEATVAAKAAQSGMKFSKKDVEAAHQEKGAQLQAVFDLKKKQAIFRTREREQKGPIVNVTEKGNLVTLVIGEEEMSFFVESQNRIRMERENIVFRRSK